MQTRECRAEVENIMKYQTRNGLFKICLFLIICISLTLSVGCQSMPASRETTVSFDDAVRMAAETISKELAATGMPAAASAADSATQEMESGNTGLDAARQRAQNFTQKPVVAVVNFTSASEELSAHVITELGDALTKNGLGVSSREDIALIRREQGFQLSGTVNDETVVAIGKEVGAQFVITGELSDMGRRYRFRVRAINVQTALRAAAASYNIDRNDSDIRHFMRAATTKAEDDRRAATAKENDERRATVAKAEAERRAVATRAFKQYSENAYRSSIEYGVNHYVEWNNNYTGLYAEPIAVHWTFLPFTSVGLGAGFGFGKTHDGQELFKAGVTPCAGLVIPIDETIRFFGDGLMEVGYNDMGGFWGGAGVSVNPGFDAGIMFSFNNGLGFNLRYKGLWAGDGNYVHSFGITLSEGAIKSNGSRKFAESRGSKILGVTMIGAGVTGAIYWLPRMTTSDAAIAPGAVSILFIEVGGFSFFGFFD